MKNMLLTATVVGAAVAGLVLYLQKKEQPKNKALDAAKDAYQVMNAGIGKIERPVYNAIG